MPSCAAWHETGSIRSDRVKNCVQVTISRDEVTHGLRTQSWRIITFTLTKLRMDTKQTILHNQPYVMEVYKL